MRSRELQPDSSDEMSVLQQMGVTAPLTPAREKSPPCTPIDPRFHTLMQIFRMEAEVNWTIPVDSLSELPQRHVTFCYLARLAYFSLVSPNSRKSP